MAIVLDVDIITELTSFDGLKEMVTAYLDRPDLVGNVPMFIRLAEARFRRVIVHPDRETTVSLAASASIALPADFLETRAAYLDNDPRQTLEQVSLSILRKNWSSQATGLPREFAISAGQIILGPAPDSAYTVQFTYQAALAYLGLGNQTNWLLRAHPDAYVYGTLLQAEAFIENDPRVPLWKGALDECLEEINRAGVRKRYGAAPLRMRTGISERV